MFPKRSSMGSALILSAMVCIVEHKRLRIRHSNKSRSMALIGEESYNSETNFGDLQRLKTVTKKLGICFFNEDAEAGISGYLSDLEVFWRILFQYLIQLIPDRLQIFFRNSLYKDMTIQVVDFMLKNSGE